MQELALEVTELTKPTGLTPRAEAVLEGMAELSPDRDPDRDRDRDRDRDPHPDPDRHRNLMSEGRVKRGRGGWSLGPANSKPNPKRARGGRQLWGRLRQVEGEEGSGQVKAGFVRAADRSEGPALVQLAAHDLRRQLLRWAGE